jgi:N6-adenosine-specific RNA methylase IME4
MKKYKTFVVDPPWPGPGACPNFKSHSAKSHIILPYSTMTGFEISALRIPELAAADAQLWLWATSRHIGDAYLLLGLWGFSFRALFVWNKSASGLGIGRHRPGFSAWGNEVPKLEAV